MHSKLILTPARQLANVTQLVVKHECFLVRKVGDILFLNLRYLQICVGPVNKIIFKHFCNDRHSVTVFPNFPQNIDNEIIIKSYLFEERLKFRVMRLIRLSVADDRKDSNSVITSAMKKKISLVACFTFTHVPISLFYICKNLSTTALHTNDEKNLNVL